MRVADSSLACRALVTSVRHVTHVTHTTQARPSRACSSSSTRTSRRCSTTTSRRMRVCLEADVDVDVGLDERHALTRAGQFVQSVYAAAKNGFAWAYDKDMHLTETHGLANATVRLMVAPSHPIPSHPFPSHPIPSNISRHPVSSIQLYAEWRRYWDVSKPILVEKSPRHMMMTRLLQFWFRPEQSFFIVVLRHPVRVPGWQSPLTVRSWRRCGMCGSAANTTSTTAARHPSDTGCTHTRSYLPICRFCAMWWSSTTRPWCLATRSVRADRGRLGRSRAQATWMRYCGGWVWLRTCRCMR